MPNTMKPELTNPTLAFIARGAALDLETWPDNEGIRLAVIDRLRRLADELHTE